MNQDQGYSHQASQSLQEALSSVSLPEKAFREAEHCQLGSPLQHHQDQDSAGIKMFWVIWGAWTGINVIVAVLMGYRDPFSLIIIVGFLSGCLLIVVLMETIRVMAQLRKVRLSLHR